MAEITLNHITKIEGHASLALKIDNNKVKKCELSAVEGSRYFEGLLKGRKYFEAHEMTSRICGICSTAHVIAAIQAVENAIGVKPSEQTVKLRLLITLGERIRSHATHLYFLALPDYLGYESALAMAPKYKKVLKRALNMMKVGNHIIKVLAARELHPVSATVGGWLKLPTNEQISEMKDMLINIKDDAKKTVELFSELEHPTFNTDYEWFSLTNEDYAAIDGEISHEKKKFKQKDYRKFFEEYHKDYSTANFVVKDDKPYIAGALARVNNNLHRLCEDAKKLLVKSGIELPSTNPYHNNFAQAIELVHCTAQAIAICEDIDIIDEKPFKIKPKAGKGVGVVEAPRGILIHEYDIDKNGIIKSANIITPTAQNLLSIQESIRNLVPNIVDKPQEDIIMDIEKLIRSFDPCFSCATHFLEVKWE